MCYSSRRPHLNKCTLFLVSTCVVLNVFLSQAPGDELSRLRLKWSGQRTEVATAWFKYRCVQLPSGRFVGKPEKISTLVQNLSNDPRYEDLATFLEELVGAADSALCEYWFDRSRSRWNIYDGTVVTLAHVNDGNQLIDFDRANAQIALLSAKSGIVSVPRMGAFRFVPFRDLDSRLSIKSNLSESDEITVEAAGIEITADKTSGLVRRLELFDEQGRVVEAIYQVGTLLFADGITFPRLAISFRWEKSEPGPLSMHWIEEASINSVIPDDVFYVSTLPNGTKIFDRRGDGKEKFVFVPTVEVNVVEYVDRHMRQNLASHPSIAESSNPWRSWLIGANIVAIVGFGGLLLFRRHRRRRLHRTEV